MDFPTPSGVAALAQIRAENLKDLAKVMMNALVNCYVEHVNLHQNMNMTAALALLQVS